MARDPGSQVNPDASLSAFGALESDACVRRGCVRRGGSTGSGARPHAEHEYGLSVRMVCSISDRGHTSCTQRQRRRSGDTTRRGVTGLKQLLPLRHDAAGGLDVIRKVCDIVVQAALRWIRAGPGPRLQTGFPDLPGPRCAERVGGHRTSKQIE